jgi:hypothetical protein
MITEKKYEELNDKLETLNSKIELLDQKFALVVDLLYSIRTGILDEYSSKNSLDSSEWMTRLSEIYPAINKFKKLSSRTYVSHGEYMNNLYNASKKYQEDFASKEEEMNMSDSEPDYPME